MSFSEKMLASLFQSVSARTAGFNSVDLAALTEPSICMMICLMFIGGSTGSTAGGLKTTTFSVLVLSIFSTVRRKKDLEAYGRRLEDGIGRTAACIFTLYIVTVLISAMVVANIENVSILEAMFECVSAIATVGLTLGITTQVGAATEIILIILMMLGRIGSVTVLLALFSDKGKIISKHAQEKIQIG